MIRSIIKMYQYLPKKFNNLGIQLNLFLKISIIIIITEIQINMNNGMLKIFNKKAFKKFKCKIEGILILTGSINVDGAGIPLKDQ